MIEKGQNTDKGPMHYDSRQTVFIRLGPFSLVRWFDNDWAIHRHRNDGTERVVLSTLGLKLRFSCLR